MKREKYKQLFGSGRKTKKPQAQALARYVGKRYAVDPAQRNWLRPWLLGRPRWPWRHSGRGLINSMGSHCPWVMPFYGLSILPILSLAAVRVARLKPVVDEIAPTARIFCPILRRRHAGPGRTVDGGGCCFLLTTGPRGSWAGNWPFWPVDWPSRWPAGWRCVS
ncbi:MAG: hypothetical protein ACLTYN_16265 [Dysosmobacter welbionis]